MLLNITRRDFDMYEDVEFTDSRKRMQNALLGEVFKRVKPLSGGGGARSSGAGKELASGALKTLGSMIDKDTKRREAGDLREAMYPGLAKTWEAGGWGGYGGGYGFKDLTPSQLDNRGYGVF